MTSIAVTRRSMSKAMGEWPECDRGQARIAKTIAYRRFVTCYRFPACYRSSLRVVDERRGVRCYPPQVFHRCGRPHPAEVADQMRLVGIARVARELRPVDALAAAQVFECPREPPNGRVAFRRETHVPREHHRKMPPTDTDFVVQLADAEIAVSFVDETRGAPEKLRDVTSDRFLEPADEALENREAMRRVGGGEQLLAHIRCAGQQFVHGHNAIGDFCEALSQKLDGADWMKPRRDEMCARQRLDDQRSLVKPRDPGVRPGPTSLVALQVVRGPEVEHDLGGAVGQEGLAEGAKRALDLPEFDDGHGEIRVWGGAVETPDADRGVEIESVCGAGHDWVGRYHWRAGA